MFANHGALVKHQHKIEGINSRMDGLQAAILSVKLKYIKQWNSDRLQNALYYSELLKPATGIQIPKIHENASHVFHLYVIRTENREQLQAFLKENGVSTGVHYPTPLPFLEAYSYLNHKPSDFPIAHNYMNKILSLPMYPELGNDMQAFVVDKILQFNT